MYIKNKIEIYENIEIYSYKLLLLISNDRIIINNKMRKIRNKNKNCDLLKLFTKSVLSLI